MYRRIGSALVAVFLIAACSGSDQSQARRDTMADELFIQISSAPPQIGDDLVRCYSDGVAAITTDEQLEVVGPATPESPFDLTTYDFTAEQEAAIADLGVSCGVVSASFRQSLLDGDMAETEVSCIIDGIGDDAFQQMAAAPYAAGEPLTIFNVDYVTGLRDCVDLIAPFESALAQADATPADVACVRAQTIEQLDAALAAGETDPSALEGNLFDLEAALRLCLTQEQLDKFTF